MSIVPIAISRDTLTNPLGLVALRLTVGAAVLLGVGLRSPTHGASIETAD